jgi:NifU-like protein involved in Fe-S cluster formation
MLPVVGAAREDHEGRFARFSLRVENEVITDVRFQASSCVTLIAYCEVAAEWVTGQTLPAAVRRVPAAKRARALLASHALIATIAATIVDGAKDARS